MYLNGSEFWPHFSSEFSDTVYFSIKFYSVAFNIKGRPLLNYCNISDSSYQSVATCDSIMLQHYIASART